MAAWGRAQADVRLTHDHDPNRQRANAEVSFTKVDAVTTGPQSGRHETLTVDLFLATEQLAADTFATLTTGSVTAWLRPDTDVEQSFVDMHECHHDGEPQPCTVAQRWPTS